MYIYRALILLLVTSSLSGQVPVETTIRILSEDPQITQETIAAIKSRLVYAGYEVAIQATDSAQLYLISTKLEAGSVTDSILFYSQLESHDLDIRLARRQGDPTIRLLYEDLGAVDGLLMYVAKDPSAIFISRDPELLDEQLAHLTERIAVLNDPHYTDLAFSWSVNPTVITEEGQGSYPAHVLYAHNADDADLRESDLHTVDIKPSTYGPKIHFELIPDAHDSWLGLTQQAADDNARTVMMILNGAVISARRMPSAIHSGSGVISRFRNRDQAMELIRKIKVGRLPAEVEIVSTAKAIQ